MAPTAHAMATEDARGPEAASEAGVEKGQRGPRRGGNNKKKKKK